MSQKRIHCFIHEAFEDLGCIEEWCKRHFYEIHYTLFYQASYQLPNTSDYDWLIIMGGPMGVYENEKYPWLKDEKMAIKLAIDENKIVLGICLGAQLIASSLGASVHKNTQKEIGWWPIQLTDDGKRNVLFREIPEEITVFHWHGDTFQLPDGAEHIAFSEATENQAFVYKGSVIGLQFHFEVTERSLAEMISFGRDELVDELFVQSASEMEAKRKFIPYNNSLMFHLLEKLKTEIDSQNLV